MTTSDPAADDDRHYGGDTEGPEPTIQESEQPDNVRDIRPPIAEVQVQVNQVVNTPTRAIVDWRVETTTQSEHGFFMLDLRLPVQVGLKDHPDSADTGKVIVLVTTGRSVLAEIGVVTDVGARLYRSLWNRISTARLTFFDELERRQQAGRPAALTHDQVKEKNTEATTPQPRPRPQSRETQQRPSPRPQTSSPAQTDKAPAGGKPSQPGPRPPRAAPDDRAASPRKLINKTSMLVAALVVAVLLILVLVLMLATRPAISRQSLRMQTSTVPPAPAFSQPTRSSAQTPSAQQPWNPGGAN